MVGAFLGIAGAIHGLPGALHPVCTLAGLPVLAPPGCFIYCKPLVRC
jgi:hypothetical protein